MTKKDNPLKEGLKRARAGSQLSQENVQLRQEIQAQQKDSSEQGKKRGRPPGRKSDPNQTQAAGYVDKELLLDVQESLYPLKRRFAKRSQVNMSVLISTFFQMWMEMSIDEQEELLRRYGEIEEEQ